MREAIFVATVLIAVTARGEQKNVHLLTGLTDGQLQEAMNLIRGSLGVHCDFCHVVEKDKGWDFASDAKDTKRTARRMIEMTMMINQQNFESTPEVSCNTCHRGNVRPVSLPILPQPVPPFPTPVRAKPANLPARDAVVAKYAAALGDVSRLNLPRTFKGMREGSDGKSVAFEGQIAGEKVHIIGQTPFGPTEQVFVGNTGWIKAEKFTREMRPAEVETFRGLSDDYEPVQPASIAAGASVINTEKIGDHDMVILRARIDDNSRQRLYFDNATGLLMRRVILRRSPIGEIPRQIDYDDYRDVDGTKFPFTVRVSLVDPWTGATRHYTEVELGAEVDDRNFDPLK